MFFNIQILKMNVHEILFQPGIVLMSVFVWKVKIVFRSKSAPLRIFLRLYFFYSYHRCKVPIKVIFLWILSQIIKWYLLCCLIKIFIGMGTINNNLFSGKYKLIFWVISVMHWNLPVASILSAKMMVTGGSWLVTKGSAITHPSTLTRKFCIYM